MSNDDRDEARYNVSITEGPGTGVRSTTPRTDSKPAQRARKAFIESLEGNGHTPLFTEWGGANKPHAARCVNGHDCYPHPAAVRKGLGVCRTCSQRDPARAETEFIERLKHLGATPTYGKWTGVDKPHTVRCANGHDTSVRPGHLRDGRGVCRPCSLNRQDVFYIVSSHDKVKFGITSGSPDARLREHRSQGFDVVEAVWEGLEPGAARELEDELLLQLKLSQVSPVRGREYFPIAALNSIAGFASCWLSASDANTVTARLNALPFTDDTQ